MLFFVEGPDNCGKTTLIRKLRKNNPNPQSLVWHCQSPPNNVDPAKWSENHYLATLKAATVLCTIGFDIYFDRSHLGEHIWGPMFRQTNSDFICNIESECLEPIIDQCYLFIITDLPSNIIKRDDGLSLTKKFETLKIICAEFKNLTNKTIIPNCAHYQIDQEGFGNMLSSALQLMED